MKYLKHSDSFQLESGAVLKELDIAYCTYGTLNKEKDNVVWVCHALTANADAGDWWSGLVGEGKLIDPEQYFIVCANILGSCYGTTGPTSINPDTGQAYLADFPTVTIRDMVKAHQLLKNHLELDKIKLALGGSMGGQQVLEWAISEPGIFENICLLATNAQHSPWGIAFNETQRMTILSDSTLYDGSPEAGKKGLEAARAIAMLSYRNYLTYERTQSETDKDKLDDFRASSYQRYQGEKLWKRFNVFSYLTLSKAMDSHNVGRGRASLEQALQGIKANTLVIGIKTDVLFPVEEQELIASHIPASKLEVIDSIFGHDGFLIEYDEISVYLQPFLDGISVEKKTSFGVPRKGGLSGLALPGTEGF